MYLYWFYHFLIIDTNYSLKIPRNNRKKCVFWYLLSAGNPFFRLIFGLKHLIGYLYFAHRKESKPGVLWISLERLQSVSGACHNISFLLDWEQSRHPGRNKSPGFSLIFCIVSWRDFSWENILSSFFWQPQHGWKFLRNPPLLLIENELDMCQWCHLSSFTRTLQGSLVFNSHS